MAVGCGDPSCGVCRQYLGGRTDYTVPYSVWVADWERAVKIVKAESAASGTVIKDPVMVVKIPPYKRRPPSTGKFQHVDRTSSSHRFRVSAVEKHLLELSAAQAGHIDTVRDRFKDLQDWQINSAQLTLSHATQIAVLRDSKEDYKDVLDRLEELAAAVDALEKS